jgi:cytochrome c5
MQNHMSNSSLFRILTAIIAATGFLTGCQYNVEQPCPDQKAQYNASIELVLSAHCTGCHGGQNPEAGLALDGYNAAANATLTGDVIDRINRSATDALVMPPNGSFTECDIILLQKWAEAGAPENE